MTAQAIAVRSIEVAATIGVGALIVWLIRLGAPPSNPRLGFWIGLTALSPIGLALLIFAVIPTYFRPLVATRIGIVGLGSFLSVAAVTYVAAQAGTRLTLDRHAAIGVVLIASSLVFGTGLQLMFLLLAPSIAVLLSH